MFGRLSDRMGRKPFLLLYPVTCCILRGATAVSPSWMSLLAGRVLTETFSPAFFAAIQASMADIVGHQGSRELAVAMAKVRTWMGVAMAAGPLVGGWVASRGGEQAPFAVASAFAFLDSVWILRVLPETLPKQKKSGIKLASTKQAAEDKDGNRLLVCNTSVVWCHVFFPPLTSVLPMSLKASPAACLALFSHSPQLAALATISGTRAAKLVFNLTVTILKKKTNCNSL
jgi:MFS family permease